MADNKGLINQIEAAMDQLMDIAARMRRLAVYLADEDSTQEFLGRYVGMSEQLHELEATIERVGLDKNSTQFARIEAKLKSFAEKNEAFLRQVKKEESK